MAQQEMGSLFNRNNVVRYVTLFFRAVRRQNSLRFIFRPQEPGKLLRFRHKALRFRRSSDCFRHLRVFRRRQLAERESRQVGIIEINFHETIRGVNGTKSRDACP